MPSDSFLLCAKKIMTYITLSSGGIIHFPVTRESWLRAQVSTKERVRHQGPAAPLPSGVPGLQRQNGSPLLQPLGQFQLTVNDVAAWHTGGTTHSQSFLSNLCDAFTLDTLMEQATLDDPIFRPHLNGPETPPPHPIPRPRHAVPCAAQSLTATATTQLSAQAQETATTDTTWWPTSSTKRPQKERAGPLGEFVVTSCFRPETPAQATTTQNLAKYETLKKTFHETANRCHQHGIRFTHWFSTATLALWVTLRSLVTWISKRQRISSSLHRESARATLRRVSLVATAHAPPSTVSDDWWPDWDDPD